MRFLLVVAAASLACGKSAPAHDPIAVQPSAALPAGVQSCALFGDVQNGQRCQVYDTKAKAFAPADSFTSRVYLYERWLDLYNTVERQVVVRNMTEAMAPGDPESKWSDPKYINYWDDYGDSAGFGDDAQNAAAYRYAVTGTDADYQRLESYVRGSVLQWEATGMDGYLARFHYAGVPPGTPLQNGRAMVVVQGGADPGRFDIPASRLDQFPDYYKQPGVKPSWEGHVSIDAYSGPMNAWPVAYSLIKDKSLKAQMAKHYTCFLKRLKIFKVINLSKNATLQSAIGQYLNTGGGVLHLDPDDPDLAKADSLWGFYLPQYNVASAANYPRDCPAALAEDAAPEDTVDVTQTGWDGKLITLFSRMTQDSDQPNSMDFAYLTSIRSGDASMMLSYALTAYRMTGDDTYLSWRDRVLIGKTNAQMVTRTEGAFVPPKPCRSYYREPNVYMSQFVMVMSDGDDATHSFGVDVWKRKFAAKGEADLGDPLFAVFDAAVQGKLTPQAQDALTQLASFGGTADHLDDPRRNYALDVTAHPPPGITIGKAPKADLDLCSTPISILGVTIPTGSPNPDDLYADKALPLMSRPPDNWQWEKDPFRPARYPGDAGHQQYAGLDLTEPYWVARYYKLLPDAHAVLAWGPQ